MRVEGRSEGLLLDLAAFTQPPSPYQVWRGALEEVTNSNEPRLVGKLAVAGYDEELWDPKPEHLPTTARTGKIITRFYQVRADDVTMLGHFQRYLTDPRSPVLDRALVPGPPRRRVVILVETDRPTIFGNPDRFRRRHRPVAVPATASAPDAGEDDAVPPGDAVFQWWCGDPTVGGRGGHWKSYRPHVSARLEEALARNPAFRDCTEAVPIDEVQYCLQRISRDRPFDYLDQNLTGGFRETFLPENVMSVDFPFFDDIARATNNCFVQFQRGNPKRRRPVRRVRRGEAAGVEVPAGMLARGLPPCQVSGVFSLDAGNMCRTNVWCCSSLTSAEAVAQLPEHQKTRAVDILNLLADGAKIHRRSFNALTGCIPQGRLGDFARCVQQRMAGNKEPQPADLEFDALVVAKLQRRVEKLRVEPRAEEANGDDFAKIHRIEARLRATPAERCQTYQKMNQKGLAAHKEKLLRYAGVAAIALGLSAEDSAVLQNNVAMHDWSKLCLPAFFAGSAYDPDLGATLADFKDATDPLLQGFFDAVVLHNLLEGSTSDGHHAASVSLLGSGDDNSDRIRRVLEDGHPGPLRVLESVLDTIEASLSKRIIDQERADLDAENSWLNFQFEQAAPGKPQALPEDLFLARMRLVLDAHHLRSVEECREACSSSGRLWGTETLKANSPLYRALHEHAL